VKKKASPLIYEKKKKRREWGGVRGGGAGGKGDTCALAPLEGRGKFSPRKTEFRGGGVQKKVDDANGKTMTRRAPKKKGEIVTRGLGRREVRVELKSR